MRYLLHVAVNTCIKCRSDISSKNNNIIIMIITYLYSAFRSEDTEALGAAQED